MSDAEKVAPSPTEISDAASDAFEVWRGGVRDGYVRYPLKHIFAFAAGFDAGRLAALREAEEAASPFQIGDEVTRAIRALTEGGNHG